MASGRESKITVKGVPDDATPEEKKLHLRKVLQERAAEMDVRKGLLADLKALADAIPEETDSDELFDARQRIYQFITQH